MKTKTAVERRVSLAASLAPEDVLVGDDVAILNETHEFPSFLWDCQSLAPHELVRLQCLPGDAGSPLHVEGVCLPFVFVKTVRGDFRTLDLRQLQLVRLDPDYARLVRREYRRAIRKLLKMRTIV